MTGVAGERDLVAHLARFAGALRQRGLRVGLGDEVDAAAALLLVDLLDRDEVRRTMRTALKIRREDWETFDEAFDRWWTTHASAPGVALPPPLPATDRTAPRSAAHTGGARAAEPSAESAAAAAGEGTLGGWSPEASLRRKPFDRCTERDLDAMQRLLERLSLRLATRRSRRLVPTRGRGDVDLRRSLRRAVGTSGEVLSLARRARSVEVPRLIALCDTSGSMDAYARFLLAFILALRPAARSTEVFAFNTALTRLTPWLGRRRIGPMLDRLAAGVPDWSGGTRIGECLAEFVARHGRTLLDHRTAVVILSDGLDRGDPAVLTGAMRTIAARARTVIWLNPLLGDPRYRPLARGMAAALPFVDHLAPAHDLASLERLLTLLAA